ncbi:MAG: ribosomal L7Ae/L30e/S12e/Gadd45 family protein [Lachnospiraceae bacterium]|nr:ribosomal L7Ae/L30e/S12e/Gadd45 family protein [Lachnospiraceae bacterium]
MQNRIDSLIGLATRAGRTVSGEDTVIKSVRDGTARVVFISAEASAGTRKKFQDKCTYYGVPYYIRGSLEELGKVTGKPFRAVVAVTDQGFANELINILSGGG